MKVTVVVETTIPKSLETYTTQEAVSDLAAHLCLELNDETLADAECALVFMDDASIQDLNRTYRHKDKPTNVLSFASYTRQELEDLDLPEGMPLELGDIMISVPTLLQEAKDLAKPAQHHLAHLIIHGICHLLGYDHNNEEAAIEMETIETRILKRANIPDPYDD